MNNLSDFANFCELQKKKILGGGAPNGILRPGRQSVSEVLDSDDDDDDDIQGDWKLEGYEWCA